MLYPPLLIKKFFQQKVLRIIEPCSTEEIVKRAVSAAEIIGYIVQGTQGKVNGLILLFLVLPAIP